MIKLAVIGLFLLLTGLLPVFVAAPSPSGEILFFEEIRPGEGHLMLLDVASGTKTPVGRSGSRPDHYPSWSADGNTIAFESYRRGGWHIWVSDAEGNQARRLTNLSDYNTSYYEFDPSFAPDNSTVVFMQDGDLFTVKLNDPTPARLTSQGNELTETAAVYSPDGQHIAFVGYRASSRDRRHIYTMNSDGSNVQQLTVGASNNMAPMWSPDGAYLLFYSDRDGSFELYEMKSDGRQGRPIMSEEQRSRAGFGRVDLVDPYDNDWGATLQYRASYSPDGQWITFSREIDGDRELFMVRRDGEALTRLTERAGLDGMPMWRPNNK